MGGPSVSSFLSLPSLLERHICLCRLPCLIFLRMGWYFLLISKKTLAINLASFVDIRGSRYSEDRERCLNFLSGDQRSQEHCMLSLQ